MNTEWTELDELTEESKRLMVGIIGQQIVAFTRKGSIKDRQKTREDLFKKLELVSGLKIGYVAVNTEELKWKEGKDGK